MEDTQVITDHTKAEVINTSLISKDIRVKLKEAIAQVMEDNLQPNLTELPDTETLIHTTNFDGVLYTDPYPTKEVHWSFLTKKIVSIQPVSVCLVKNDDDIDYEVY